VAADLPPRAIAKRISDALEPLRARLLRRAGIAHRGPVLDVGAGWGFVTEELARRARGPVVAVDRRPEAVEALGERGVLAEAVDLPFAHGHFELIFCQHVLMWQSDLASVLRELRRVLAKDGVLVAIEPDWGGALEHPASIAVAEHACAALARAGADPRVGRALPSALHAAGFTDGRVDLSPSPSPADNTRFALLEDLDLTADEASALAAARAAQAALPPHAAFVHVPVVAVSSRAP
jgi:SAM-dependent methyltransferase